MNKEDYRKREDDLYTQYKTELHKLRTEYVENNKKFNIGDFVFNVTGIIKVERIGYVMFFDNTEIVYYGYRYRKVKGENLRTKDKVISSLSESNNLKLLINN